MQLTTDNKISLSIAIAIFAFLLYITASSHDYQEETLEQMPDSTKLMVIRELEDVGTYTTPDNIFREYTQHPEKYK